MLAHELGHWHYSHPAKLLLVSQANLIMTLALFSFFIKNVYVPATRRNTDNSSLYSAFGFQLGSRSAVLSPTMVVEPYLPVLVGLELFQLVLHPTDTLLQIGINAIVRRMEYAADRCGAPTESTDRSFAAKQKRPPPSSAQTSAVSLAAKGQTVHDDATVKAWIDHLAGEAHPGSEQPEESEPEPYTALLSRALVKLNIEK